MLWSKRLNGTCAKLHTVAASNNRDHPTRSLYFCLFTSHIFVCCFLRTSHLWWIALSTQHQLRGCNNVPSFLLWTAPIAHSFCEGCTWHHLHILVKAPLCCDWKAQASSMQSFTLWQQATIEIVFILFQLVCKTYIWVFFFMYIPFVANHTLNTTPTKGLRHFQQIWTRLFEMTKSEWDK